MKVKLYDSTFLQTQKDIGKNTLIMMLLKWVRYQSSFWTRNLIPKIKAYGSQLTQKQFDTIRRLLKGKDYWKAMSHINAVEATVWGQIHQFNAANIRTYQIQARMDRATCPPCVRLNGTVYKVRDAMDSLSKKADTLPEDLVNSFPFPREAELDKYDELSESPYNLIPMHAHCRCQIIPIG